MISKKIIREVKKERKTVSVIYAALYKRVGYSCESEREKQRDTAGRKKRAWNKIINCPVKIKFSVYVLQQESLKHINI
jgi:hypothetical protein